MKTIFNKFIVRFSAILACLSILPGISSCVEEDMPFIVLNQEEIEVGTEAEKYTIDVKSNLSWTVACDEDWIQLYNAQGQYKGQFAFAVSANETTQERTAVVTVTSSDGAIQATVMVRQSPKNAELFLTKEKAYFNKEAGKQVIRVVSNHDWKVISSEDWCTVSPEEGKSSAEFEIKVEENLSGVARKATVSVVCEINVEEPIIRNVEVIQEGTKFFFAVPTAKFFLSSEVENDGRYLYIPYETSDENVEIRLSADVDWIDVESKDVMMAGTKAVVRQELEVFVEANETGAERTGKLTLTVLSEGQDPILETVEIVQSGENFFFVISTKEYNVANGGDSLKVDYKASGSYTEITHNADVDWIEVKESEDQNTHETIYTLHVAENLTDADRTGKVTFSASCNGSEPVMETIVVNQTCKDFYFAVPVKEFQVSNEETALLIRWEVSGQNVRILPEASCDWIELEMDEYGAPQLTAIAAANDSGKDRKGQIILSASNNGGKPIVETIDVLQGSFSNEIAFTTTELQIDPQGETVQIPFTANEQPEVTCSSIWCQASIASFENGAGIIEVVVEGNYTEGPREGLITATICNESGKTVSNSIRLTQQNGEFRFSFSEESINLDPMASTSFVTLESNGEWEIEEKSIPTWLKVEPISGSGDETISIEAKANMFVRNRTASIIAKNLKIQQFITLTIVQQENANGLNDFKYLGKGFDGSGVYAHDSYVKAAVLDQDKLYQNNHISDLLTPNQTVETTIAGRTRNEYEQNYTKNGSIGGSIKLFSASVSNNFSQAVTGSFDHSFASFRHATKKQIIKLNENETAEDLKSCLSDQFKFDMAKLSPEALVLKYGTHVISGFSVGGVLEYSMSTLCTSYGDITQLQRGVSAGFEKMGKGANIGNGREDYNTMSKSEYEFEERLICRGGESQYASNADGTMSTYQNWLKSLENRDKWVMVDYEGRKLIPIWDFVDASMKDAVKSAAEQYILERQIETGIAKKMVVSVDKVFNSYDDGGSANGQFTFALQAAIDDNAWTNIKNMSEADPWDIWPGERHFGRNAYTADLDVTKPHKLWLRAFGVREHDSGWDKKEVFEDCTLTLNFDRELNAWIADTHANAWIEHNGARKEGNIMEPGDEARLHCKLKGNGNQYIDFFFRLER